MKIVFMGTPEFSANVLTGLILEKYDVSLVVSQPNKPVGRHHNLKDTPVVKVAKENNIKVFQPNNIKEDYDEIKNVNPDIIITCAYGQIIPEELINLPRLGCINVHASILPKYRGGAPIHRAIINGDKVTGVTIMYMDKSMDTGDIISIRECKIEDDDNLDTLFNKLSDIGRSLLLDTLPSIIDKTNSRIPQDNSKATYAYNIKKEETKIDFSDNTLNIYNKIRGLSPSIGCFCYLNDNIFKVYGARIGKFRGEVGKVTKKYDDSFGVATGNGEIIFTIVQPAGKKKMNATEFMRGFEVEGVIFK